MQITGLAHPIPSSWVAEAAGAPDAVPRCVLRRVVRICLLGAGVGGIGRVRGHIAPDVTARWAGTSARCPRTTRPLLRGFDTPSLHRLEAGNANLLISTMGGTSPVWLPDADTERL